MIGVRLGLSEHIKDPNAVFSLILDEDDINIQDASEKGKDLLKVIGDCGDEYLCYSDPPFTPHTPVSTRYDTGADAGHG